MRKQNLDAPKFSLAIVIVLLIGLGVNTNLDAQVVGATLSGTITDPSAAVVPNAMVEVDNTETGVGRTVSSNATGLYTAPNLLPGPYKVTATATGFAAQSTTVTLAVGTTQTLNFTLKVGTTAETVEVTDVAPTVNLEDASIGGLNNETTVKELPLNGRSWTDLAALQPGVNALRAQAQVDNPDRFSRGFGDQISISGGRPEENNYRLNGISINDPTNGGPGSVLGGNMGVDAISEFSVLTTGYAAEYGRASGGVINAITKSGSNAWHGDGYEFFRNAALDAKNYFDNPAAKIPPFRRNQFGASLGGPIQKDKTFIFGDYEGLRQFLSVNTSATVPTAGAHNGILGPGDCNYPNPGACAPITLAQCPTDDPNGYVIPVPGQTNTCVDKQALRYLNAFWPLPPANAIISGNGDAAKYNLTTPHGSTENYFTIRADHKFSDSDTVSGVYFFDWSTTITEDRFLSKSQNQQVHRQYYLADWSHIFSTTKLNDFRAGVNRYIDGAPGSVTALNAAAADPSFAFEPGDGSAGGISIGATGAGGATFSASSGGLYSTRLQTHFWMQYQFDDDFQLTRGKHTIKFGASIERNLYDQFTSAGMPNGFTFKSLHDFLLNIPFSVGTTVPTRVPLAQTRQGIYGVYVQDDYHAHSDLTFNFGVRYEPASVPYEKNPNGLTQNSSLIPTPVGFTNNGFPGSGIGQISNLYSITNSATSTHVGNPLFQNNTLYNFAPRFGFAWDPSHKGKVAIRGAYGFYDNFIEASYCYQCLNQLYPLQLQSAVNNPTFRGFPTQAITDGIASLTAPGKATARPQFFQPNPPRIYVEQWNVSFSQQILKNLAGLVAYVGRHGVHGEEVVDNGDAVLPLIVPGVGDLWPCEPFSPVTGCGGWRTGTRLNPNVGGFKASYFGNSATYRALVFQLTERMAHGFQAQGSFTWSNAKDEASGGLIGDQFTNGLSNGMYFVDPKLTHANADFNQPRVLTFNFDWQIPTPKSLTNQFATKALGGWEMGTIFTAADGVPFTPLLGGGGADGVGSFIGLDYPDFAPGCNAKNAVNPGNVLNYINTACFVAPAAVVYNGVHYLRYGNAGRNSVQGPGLMGLDFSLIKNIRVQRISETFNVQFRAEFFNILNHPNFLPPTDHSNIIDPSIGGFGIVNPMAQTIDTGQLDAPTATTSRQIQFALKFIF